MSSATPVYRVQLFRRRQARGRRMAPAREVIERATGDMGGLRAAINWGGCAVTRLEAANAWTTRAVPILMYHRIATDGPAALAPYRVDPRPVRAAGGLFAPARLPQHHTGAVALGACGSVTASIDDRVVVLTFDDAYRDFLSNAWPILRSYGFCATMFVPTDHVGGRAEWDRGLGEPAELMSWDELRMLAGQGLEIGAHSCSHPYLTRLPPAQSHGRGPERQGAARGGARSHRGPPGLSLRRSKPRGAPGHGRMRLCRWR